MSTPRTITPEDLLAHQVWLQRLACRLVDPASAEDLVQETWAAAVRTQPDRERPLRPWLGEVLRNLARMRARSRSRWHSRQPRLIASESGALPSPEELLTYHEAQRLVAEAVARLDEPYRSTVLLCYAQEIPPREIARRQSIPDGTVRWRLKRGLDRLREDLDQRYGRDRDAWRALLGPLTTGGAAASTAASTTVAAKTSLAAATTAVAGVTGAGSLRFAGWAAGWKLPAAVATVAVIGTAAWLWGGGGGSLAPVAGDSQDREERSGRSTRSAVPRLTVPPTDPGAGPPGPAEPGSRGSGGPTAAPAAAPAMTPEQKAAAVERAIQPGDSPARGNPQAPVTIVIYSEFQCPFCARVLPTLHELEQAYPDQLRFVWKHLPLAFHESAALASEAALAAHEQGKFWEMHDRLFARQDRLDPAALAGYARELGLDVERFMGALESGKYRDRVQADLMLAKEADINGAPTFFINGERLTGAQPLAAFEHQVEVALAKVKGLPPPTPPAKGGAPEGDPRPRDRLGAGPGRKGNRAGRRFRIPFWPPPDITLPAPLLGPRVALRMDTSRAPIRGNPKGPVEVLHLTHLRDFETRLIAEGLLASYGEHIRLVVKVLPVNRAGARPLLAETALYAQSQGKFQEFVEALGIGPAPEEAGALESVAEKIGLDLADLRAVWEGKRFQSQLEQDVEAVRAARLAWPALIVAGRVAEGSVSAMQLTEAAIRKAGRKPPPREKNPASPPTSPADPAYDPKRLLGSLSLRQIFANESRDGAWATAVEKGLGPMVAGDLRAVNPDLASSTVECRFAMCRVRWRMGKGDEQAVLAAARTLYGSLGPPQPGNESYFVARTSTARSAADSIDRVKGKRSAVLFNHRTGRALQPAGFPIERLAE